MILLFLLYFSALHGIECSSINLKFDYIGKIQNGHVIVNSKNATFCRFEDEKDIVINFQEQLNLLKEGSHIVMESNDAESKIIADNYRAALPHYKEAFNFYLTEGSSLLSYNRAVQFCHNKNGKLVQVTNDKILDAITKLFPDLSSTKIWQEIHIVKNRVVFIVGNKPTPNELKGTSTSGSVPEPEEQCGYFDILSKKFLFAQCSTTATVICEMDLSVTNMLKLLISSNNLKYVTHELGESIENFLNTFQSLPEGDNPTTGFLNLSLFAKTELNVLNNFHSVDKNRIFGLTKEYIDFFQIESRKINVVETGMRNIGTLRTNLDICCINLFDSIFSSSGDNKQTLSRPRKHNGTLVFSSKKAVECTTYQTFKIVPLITNSKVSIHGTFTKNGNSPCLTVNESCTKDVCSKSTLIYSDCCAYVAQNSSITNCSCKQNSDPFEFLMKNDTHVLVNNVQKFQVLWTCQNTSIETNVVLGKLWKNDTDCKIEISLGNIMKLSQVFILDKNLDFIEITLPETNTDSESSMINKVLTYAAFLASVSTVLMFIFSLYMYLRQKSSNNSVNNQNLQNLQANEPIPLRPIIRTPRRSRRSYTSSDSSSD